MKKKRIIKFTSLSLLLLFSLTSCNTEEIKERISTVVYNMLPNLWITLMQLGLFILVAILFIFLAYKPLKKKMNKRSEYIVQNIKDSEDKNNEAKENLAKSAKIIADSEKKAGEIIEAAQKTAEVKASEAEKELSLKLENDKLRAHEDIENERKNMLKEAHSLIVESAISTSKEILKKEVTVKDNDEYINEFIDELLKDQK